MTGLAIQSRRHIFWAILFSSTAIGQSAHAFQADLDGLERCTIREPHAANTPEEQALEASKQALDKVHKRLQTARVSLDEDLARPLSVRVAGDAEFYGNVGEVASSDTDAQCKRFCAIFGVGASVGIDDYIDYKVVDDQLLVVNNSQIRPAGFGGLSFPVNDKVGILLGGEFGTEARRSLDGFVLGVTYCVAKPLSIGLGFGLRRGQEFSPAFDRAAKQQDPTLYNDPTNYDGLKLKDTKGVNKFTTPPLIDSHNKTFWIGIVVPVSILPSE